MKELLKRFFIDERGLETVEWAIVGAVIAAITAATISAIANTVGQRFEDINEVLNPS